MGRLPKLCKHQGKRQWYLRIQGQFIYLGNLDTTTETEAESARLKILQQYAAGTNPKQFRHHITVAEVVEQYLVRVVDERYRRRDGSPTSEVSNHCNAFRPLVRIFGEEPAADFGGNALEALQKAMAGDSWKTDTEKRRPTSRPWCCSQINKHISRIKRCFKWAAGKKLCPAEIVGEHALVEPIRPGQYGTKEPPEVPPVPIEVLNATLPALSPVLVDMIRVQLLTGSRPGEICGLTPGQIDRSGKKLELITKGAFCLPPGCWAILPDQHKTQIWGKTRIIPVGPQCQKILLPYLERNPDQPIFSPIESKEISLASRRANRKTPLTPSQKKRTRKKNPKKNPGSAWTPSAYAAAIRKAALKTGQPHWHPHQIRHLSATILTREFGIETARVICGHSSVSATAIYAERDLSAAFAAISKHG